MRNAFLALAGQDPSDWYASRLHASFEGVGTVDKVVCRILGAHDKRDVKRIASSYERKCGALPSFLTSYFLLTYLLN